MPNDVDAIRPIIEAANRLVIADDPVPESTVAAVIKVASAHRNDRFGAYYDTLATRLAYYAAWQSSDHKASIAKALQVDGVRSGTFAARDDKQLHVAVSSQVGRCYLLASRWQRAAGREVSETDVQMKMVPAAGVVGFAVMNWAPSRDYQELLYGGCPLSGGTLQFEVDVPNADGMNPLDWVILSWPRDHFPEAFSSSLRLMVDPCDTEVWTSAWTKPIAGTLGYLASEPVLLTRPRTANDSWSEVENLSGQVNRISTRQLSTRPTGHIKVGAPYWAPECKRTPATNASSSKYSACMAEVDGRYQAQIAVAESRERTAESAVVRDLGSQQAGALLARRDHDRDRCKPLYTSIAADHKRAFETVRTTLEHTEATSTTAGIARMLADYAAFE